MQLDEEDMQRLAEVKERVKRGERGVPHEEVMRELAERERKERANRA